MKFSSSGASMSQVPVAGAPPDGALLSSTLPTIFSLTNALLLLVAALAAISALTVGIAHLSDHYMLEHVSGAWMAQAQSAAEGTLYPPLFDGTHYGGTRYMPLSILLHAGIGAVTGDPVLSGKLLNLITSGLLAVTVFVATASTGLTLAQRAFCATLLWLTYPGVLVTAGIRNDALPVVLQLAAVLLADRTRSRAVLVFAGLLCALAVLAKVSALWAPAAIGLVLLVRDPRGLLAFVPAFLGGVVAGVLAANAYSDGRMFENLQMGAYAAPLTPAVIAENAERLIEDFRDRALVGWVMVPFALLGIVLSLLQRRLSMMELSFVFAAILTFAVYMDPGAWSNHLIDLIVLGPLVAAGYWAGAGKAAAVGLSALLLFTTASATVSLGNAFSAAAATVLGRGVARDPVAAHISADQTILSQDAYIPIARGQKPVIADPFMLRRISVNAPELVAPLVARIQNHEFDRIVLMFDLSDREHYLRKAHFSEELWLAIEEKYTLVAGPIDRRYYIYAPRT